MICIFLQDHGSPTPGLIDHCDEFIFWPCAAGELGLRLDRALAGCVAEAPPSTPFESPEALLRLNLIGRSEPFRQTLRRIRKIADCDASVLVRGETGTGKEVAARAIHYLGARHDHPFIPVNCGALPDHLLENELFGHERGAFTDAREAQPGLIALADGGTLLLDEIDALSGSAQVALLRFLQDREYKALGGQRFKKADVRVIAASNADLSALVAERHFRQDLLHRLHILTLDLPPLRERREDIELLARYFLRQYSRQYRRPPKRLPVATLRWMESHSWPGNVRELENFIHQNLLLADGDQLLPPAAADLVESAGADRSRIDLGLGFSAAKARVIQAFEREYLSALLAENGGNVTLAARQAGKERRALGKLLKKHGIARGTFTD